MLWLCLHFAQLPAEALGLREPLEVVTEQRGAQRWLITAGAGIAAGTHLGAALAMRPTLRAHPRKPAAEQAALQRLAHWIYRYGSPVCCEIREFAEAGRSPQALLWVEISASLQLFGGLDAVQAAMRADLAEFEQSARLAIAPSRAAAALFAVHGLAGVDADAALDPALAALSTAALPWPQAQLDALQGLGLRHLGAVFDLPRGAFARRFGTASLHELDRLRGRAAEPAQALVPPAQFRRRFELAAEVDNVEALLFPLRRLAFELQGWLRARDLGLRAVRLACTHAQRRRTRLTLRFGSAHRDGRRLFETLRERLLREPLGGAVRALELEALELAAAEIVQAGLFDDGKAGAACAAAVERIAARLGEAAVWTPRCRAEHRPEHAFERLAAATPAPGAAEDRHTGTTPPRPLWLLAEPQPLPASVSADGAVERIASGWWDGGDVRRDYYAVELQQRHAWIFQARDSGRWFLHGLWG